MPPGDQSSNDLTDSLRDTAAELYGQSRRLLVCTGTPDSDSESDTSDSEAEPELNEDRHWVNRVTTYIECLTDIGIALERPALEPGSREQASLIDLEQRTAHDYHTDLILAKHPQADPDLAQALGRLSWDRYERLQLHRERQAQLAKDVGFQAFEGKSRPAGTEFGTEFQDSGIGTSLPATVTSYAKTTVSFMTSMTTGGDRIRIPPLPEEAKNGESFECVACCMKVHVTDNRTWR